MGIEEKQKLLGNASIKPLSPQFAFEKKRFFFTTQLHNVSKTLMAGGTDLPLQNKFRIF